MTGTQQKQRGAALGLSFERRHGSDDKQPITSAPPAGGVGDLTGVPAKAKKPAFAITSETSATFPANRTRRLLGLGEVVTLRTSPAVAASWSLTGAGAIAPANGDSTTFTAPQDRGKSVVTAEVGGEAHTASFTTIRPNGMTSKVNSHPLPGVLGPPNNRMGARTVFDCTVLPVSVSFDFARFRENIPRREFTWPDGTDDVRPAEIVDWTTTNNVTQDQVTAHLEPIARLTKGGKEKNFFIHISVPEEFQDDAGNWIPWLPNEKHLREYIAGGKARATMEATNNVAGTWQGPWQ